MPSYAITGAARGIGFEFARNLSSSEGNVVFAIVRNKATANRLVELKRSNVHILEADVTDVQALKAAAEEVSKVTGGKLDMLINNAAYIDTERSFQALDDYPTGDEAVLEKDLLDNFKVNVIGVIHATNAFLPLVRAGDTKKVITISSGAGDTDYTLALGFANWAPYSISKAAVNTAVAKFATKYKNDELGPIIFLSICPGPVDTAVGPPTPEQIKFFGALMTAIKKNYPDFKGRKSPEEAVKMVLEVIDKATIADTGTFVSHKGNKEWL